VIELFHRGLELQKIGLVDEAQVIYEQILNSNPLHYEALEYACTHLAQQKDWNKIRFLLNNAIRLNNLNPYLYNNLGIVLHELKDFEESIKVYKQALRLNPNFAEGAAIGCESRQNVKKLTRLDGVFVIEVCQFSFWKYVGKTRNLCVFGGACDHGSTQSTRIRAIANFYVLSYR
jgi:tetratricopeptide (TPR) repeat protein